MSPITLYPHPETEIPSVSQFAPLIPSLLGELPIMDNAPIVRSSSVGANLVIVKSPAVRSSIEAATPDGPAAVEEVPPGAIATSALPQSTISISIESRDSMDASA